MRASRRLYLQPKTEPLEVTQSRSVPAVVSVNLCAARNRHRLSSMTSQFAIEDGTIRSHAISLGACPHAIEPLCRTKAASPRLDDLPICCPGPYQRRLVFVAPHGCKLAAPRPHICNVVSRPSLTPSTERCSRHAKHKPGTGVMSCPAYMGALISGILSSTCRGQQWGNSQLTHLGVLSAGQLDRIS